MFKGFTPSLVPQTTWHSLVLSSLLRITLTLACPMDLKNFPMDVQTCIMQLESCESCAHLHFGEETTCFPFPFHLPSPSSAATHSQFSLHWRLAQDPLGQDFPFTQHMQHFLEKPNLKRSHGRSSGFLVFTLAFHFGGERWKCFQLQMGFFLSGWTFAPCTRCLSQRRERQWTTSLRERGQVWNNSKQPSRPN